MDYEVVDMTITVEIADRLYDYTDEEKASAAVSAYQGEFKLNDATILSIWADDSDPRRAELERRIFDAVDLNGTARRAAENVPAGVSLLLDEEVG